MCETTELKIVPGYPIHIEAVEKPKYEVITLETSQLSGCDLDCALAVSLLTEGTLYLSFLPDGRSFLVSYQALGQDKKFWSPSSDEVLARNILQTHIPSWTGEYLIQGLREIILKELGSSVDSLRIKGSAA